MASDHRPQVVTSMFSRFMALLGLGLLIIVSVLLLIAVTLAAYIPWAIIL